MDTEATQQFEHLNVSLARAVEALASSDDAEENKEVTNDLDDIANNFERSLPSIDYTTDNDEESDADSDDDEDDNDKDDDEEEEENEIRNPSVSVHTP